MDHQSWQALLRRLRSPVDAAELHGSLSGYLSAGVGVDRDNWLLAIAQDELAEALHGSDETQEFARLYEDTRDALLDPDYGFEPLVPGEEAAIVERSQALVAWVRSYLSGLGLTGIEPAQYLSDEAQEALNDLAKIAATRIDEVEASDEAEDDLQELHEFVRMSVILIAEECTELREQASGKH